MFWRREKSLATTGIRTQDCPVHRIVAVATTTVPQLNFTVCLSDILFIWKHCCTLSPNEKK